ncbi:hypothetical protein ACC758_38480, partial [Rhizobium ruizarguesonis]
TIFEVSLCTPQLTLLLFLITVGPKGRFDPRRAAEAIHSSANKAVEVGAKAKAGRDMVKPIGEVKAPLASIQRCPYDT